MKIEMGKEYQTRDGRCDLIEKPKTFQYERWVNIYENYGPSTIYCTRLSADEYALEGRIACVPVVIEGKEGDGL